MRFSHVFIDRPIFASVLSILIIIAGVVALPRLPVSEYPEVVPPTIVVSASYPGASPETIAETVAAPIEQAINGVEGMEYISSQSTADGSTSIQVTFALGADLDLAQVLVQNRVAAAEARLPEEVRRLGVTVNQSAPNTLMILYMVSPDESLDQTYISNYTSLRIRDQLSRLDGIGDVQVFGAREYAMRIWLDPARLAARDLTAGDVVTALRAQNVQVAAGAIGAEPRPGTAPFELTIEAPGRLVEPEQFADVVVRTDAGGAIVRVRDVARVELGAQDYVRDAFLGGKPSVAIGVSQRPGSNSLATAADVVAAMERLEADFPKGLEYRVVYNPTAFVATSIEKVQLTLIEAVLLVVLVVFLFLQSMRAAIIPILAIPVSIIGTMAVLLMLGGSINTLSLFGLILAIGIVVDDAIVVVENVERNLAQGLSPREAARKTMDEVGGALIAIALVLVSVFVPVAFLGGIAGEFYRQFAITIATATAISCFVSLTLSPAMCAAFLKPHDPNRRVSAWQRPLQAFFAGFNRAFDALGARYGRLTRRLVRMGVVVSVLYVGLLGLTGAAWTLAPKGFIPAMDRGYAFVAIQLPPGSSLQRTRSVLVEASERLLSVDGVVSDPGFAGFSAATGTTATNAATIFFTFEDFDDRKGRSADAIIADVNAALSEIEGAFIVVVAPPAVEGLGSGSDLKLMVQDREGRRYGELSDAVQALASAANATEGVGGAFTFYEVGTPRLKLDIDRDKAEALGVSSSEINAALETHFGSAYVNDFNFLGRTYRVTAQADAPFRASAEDIGRVQVRTAAGAMVPLASVVTVAESAGPQRVPRYNLYPSAELNVSPAPGVSTGALIERMERLAADTLPAGFSYEWTEIAFQQKAEGGGVIWVFLLATLFVFLVLAAQYESVALPFAVILIVPMAILGALAGVLMRGLDVNLLTQVSFVVLVGLAAKNAILIVEFAHQLEREGRDRFVAAVEAARLRLRPILMTSLAFILGVVPLAIATGAGAEQRIAIGTAVFAGMLGVTIVGLLLTPAFYVMVRGLQDRLASRRGRPPAPEREPNGPHEPAAADDVVPSGGHTA